MNTPETPSTPPSSTGQRPCYLWDALDGTARSCARWVARHQAHRAYTGADDYLFGGLRWPHLCAVCQMVRMDSSLEGVAKKLLVGAIDSDLMDDAHEATAGLYDTLAAVGEGIIAAGECPFTK